MKTFAFFSLIFSTLALSQSMNGELSPDFRSFMCKELCKKLNLPEEQSRECALGCGDALEKHGHVLLENNEFKKYVNKKHDEYDREASSNTDNHNGNSGQEKAKDNKRHSEPDESNTTVTDTTKKSTSKGTNNSPLIVATLIAIPILMAI
ncbi:hypothetical protein BB560_003045 [Smittium megazygosporum]|uniref:Uncharacterized protein n=1 Tax=Smittium megazygosporum TaxID=133381 RepID=A0A2T9ZD34_9FUNG|nr:hypothetical protein BB560_003045 [Smittium megazygosporum]